MYKYVWIKALKFQILNLLTYKLAAVFIFVFDTPFLHFNTNHSPLVLPILPFNLPFPPKLCQLFHPYFPVSLRFYGLLSLFPVAYMICFSLCLHPQVSFPIWPRGPRFTEIQSSHFSKPAVPFRSHFVTLQCAHKAQLLPQFSSFLCLNKNTQVASQTQAQTYGLTH